MEKHDKHDILNIERDHPTIIKSFGSSEKLSFSDQIGFYSKDDEYRKKFLIITNRNLRLYVEN
jgi:hypothetical protein